MRKAPRQARARATTEAILDAAARILGERGWTGLTTNATAERAGVSIGSLYQYFPNKLALIEAVRKRHFDQVLAVLHAAADPALPRAHRIAALVDGMIAVHSRHPAAHRVLLEETPRAQDVRSFHDRFDIACRNAYEALVAANSAGPAEDIPIRARLLAGAVAGAVHEAARGGMLSSPVLRQQFIAFLDAYLSRRQERLRSAGNP